MTLPLPPESGAGHPPETRSRRKLTIGTLMLVIAASAVALSLSRGVPSSVMAALFVGAEAAVYLALTRLFFEPRGPDAPGTRPEAPGSSACHAAPGRRRGG